MSGPSGPPPGPPAPTTEQEFVVRVPSLENANKKHHVMKFNASQNMDFSKWSQVRMVRENNMKTFSHHNQEEMPKHGAGSEFGREEKEEARKKKFGYVSRKYNPEAQPWLMRIGGKNGRKYKGVREGGVSANTTFYVFTHAADGSFEAYPVHEWYNFTPIMRYKTLDADEAEEKFAQRGKILNKWAMMVKKKLKPDQEDDEDLDGDGDGKKKGKKTAAEKKDLKISELDDWDGSDDGLDTDDDEKEEKDDDSDDGKKKKKGKDSKGKKKKNKNDVNEAFEDDGDGSDEDREVDYMSDESSASEEEKEKERELKGVDQDQGLSKMLDSDDSDSDEEKKKKEGEKSDEEKDGEGKKKKGASEKGNSSDEEGGKGKKKSENSSRSTTPTKDVEKNDKAEKRKAMVANLLDPNASNEPSSKKSRLDQFGSSSGAPMSSAVNEAISEEAVRKYLTRRPMTTTDLLKKFRSKKTGIQNAQLVQLLAQILKKINPHKQKIKGTTYLSLKEGK